MPDWPPKKNVAFTISLPILDADGDPVVGAATLSGVVAGADGVAVLGAFGATATPTDEGEGFYDIALTAAQMNFDRVAGVLKTATAGAKNTPFTIYTVARQIADLAFPVVSGRGVDVDATGGVEVGTNLDKTGYSLTQAFPANFAALSISAAGLVDILQTAADKVWGSATRTLTAFSTALALSVWDVLETAILTASSIGLKVKNNLDAAISTRSSHAAADIWAAATRLLTAGTNIVLAKGVGVTGFTDLSAAQVNAEVVDALNVDTYAEPAQGAPPATATLVQRLQYLYKAFRNRATQTASQYSLYGDDAVTVHHKATFADDGTTADRAEIAAGP